MGQLRRCRDRARPVAPPTMTLPPIRVAALDEAETALACAFRALRAARKALEQEAATNDPASPRRTMTCRSERRRRRVSGIPSTEIASDQPRSRMSRCTQHVFDAEGLEGLCMSCGSAEGDPRTRTAVRDRLPKRGPAPPRLRALAREREAVDAATSPPPRPAARLVRTSRAVESSHRRTLGAVARPRLPTAARAGHTRGHAREGLVARVLHASVRTAFQQGEVSLGKGGREGST